MLHDGITAARTAKNTVIALGSLQRRQAFCFSGARMFLLAKAPYSKRQKKMGRIKRNGGWGTPPTILVPRAIRLNL